MADYYVDGYTPPRGVNSKQAVKRIQAVLHVEQDGVWGRKTQAAWQLQGLGNVWKPEAPASNNYVEASPSRYSQHMVIQDDVQKQTSEQNNLRKLPPLSGTKSTPVQSGAAPISKANDTDASLSRAVRSEWTIDTDKIWQLLEKNTGNTIPQAQSKKTSPLVPADIRSQEGANPSLPAKAPAYTVEGLFELLSEQMKQPRKADRIPAAAPSPWEMPLKENAVYTKKRALFIHLRPDQRFASS